MRARKLSFSAESVEAAHIFGQSRSRAEYVQNLSAIAFDTAENEFLQVRLLFLFENASLVDFQIRKRGHGGDLDENGCFP